MPRYRARSHFVIGLGDGTTLPLEGPRMVPWPGDLLPEDWVAAHEDQVKQLLQTGAIVEVDEHDGR